MHAISHPAQSFCHYTRAETAFSHIIPTGALMMNPYGRMRDPFENKHPFLRSLSGFTPSSPDPADPRDHGKAEAAMFWEVQNDIARCRDGWVLLSLTRYDDRGGLDDRWGASALYRSPWSRPRLWEQYADNHAGVCLVFERDSMIRAFSKSLTPGESEHGAVDYSLGGLASSDASMALTRDFVNERMTIAEMVRMYVSKHSRDFFFLKSEDWASEWEYRFIYRRFEAEAARDAAQPNFASYGDSLRAIIVGERFPTWQLPGAMAVADSAGVELRRMTWDVGWPSPREVEL
jgi:hypothetical protein